MPYVAWPSKRISRYDYYRYVNSPDLTPRTKTFIEDVKEGREVLMHEYEWRQKFYLTKKTNCLEYFRKMSRTEYESFALLKYKGKPLLSACDYTNKELYRVWLSSRLEKCRVFGNENATTGGDVIVKFIFKKAVMSLAVDIQPHQKTGVQDDPSILAVHREGFCHLGQLGVDELTYVKDQHFDHNIGICRQLLPTLHENLTRWVLVP